ncbi:MAG: M23 family metallopeptidase [Hyphomonadaceae bacterium]
MTRDTGMFPPPDDQAQDASADGAPQDTAINPGDEGILELSQPAAPARKGLFSGHVFEWGLGVASAAVLGGGLFLAGGMSRVVAPAADAGELDVRAQVATYNHADDLEIAPREMRQGAVRRNETLVGLLDRIGADHADSSSAAHAASKFIDLRHVRVGENVTTWFETDPSTGATRMAGMSLRPEADRQVLVARASSGEWVTHELVARLTPAYRDVAAQIDTSIYEAALAGGARDQQVADYAQIFGYDIDFQREVHPGDQFEIFYETFNDERGAPVKTGDVLYASMQGKALTKAFYRFSTTDDGQTDYYDESGQSAKKFLMKTPINGARLSSGFGNRRHPVLGYTKLHKGTDFAAPVGTPIYAAGNGVIERIGPWSTYGNYIRIQHANGYQTAYAHMSRFARGLRKGARVRQGQVIGYVGATGRVTGPHLHYEVYVHSKPVNAMKLRLPTGRKLDGEQLQAFLSEKSRIDALRDAEFDRQKAVAMAKAEQQTGSGDYRAIPVAAPAAPDQRPGTMPDLAEN